MQNRTENLNKETKSKTKMCKQQFHKDK
jgi:hypothetical protein